MAAPRGPSMTQFGLLEDREDMSRSTSSSAADGRSSARGVDRGWFIHRYRGRESGRSRG